MCGKSQTGKSTMVEVLLHSLRKHTREHDRDSQMAYHHEHINVLAVSSLNQMFGTINDEASGSGGGKQTAFLFMYFFSLTSQKLSLLIVNSLKAVQKLLY